MRALKNIFVLFFFTVALFTNCKKELIYSENSPFAGIWFYEPTANNDTCTITIKTNGTFSFLTYIETCYSNIDGGVYDNGTLKGTVSNPYGKCGEMEGKLSKTEGSGTCTSNSYTTSISCFDVWHLTKKK